MKICPFVSHMLGDEHSNTFTLGEAGSAKAGFTRKENKTDNIVILGYEADGTTPVQAETATEVAPEEPPGGGVPTHLYCLKESCRFYKEQTGDCQFDLIFSMLSEQKTKTVKRNASDITRIAKELSKDIDKVWKFQTKSVAELIKSLGDSEKHQSKSLTSFKKDLDKKLESLAKGIGKPPPDDVGKRIASLQKTLEERERGIENLSSTMSELVLNVHESIRKLQDKYQAMSKQIEQIGKSLPSADSIRTLVADSTAKRVKGFDSPEISARFRLLQDKIEEAVESAGSGRGFESQLERALSTQKDLEKRIAAWHDDILDKVQDLKTQQNIWEERFKHFTEHQDQLAAHLEESRTHRKSEQADAGKKKARKYNNLGVTSFHNGAFEMAKDQFLQAVKVDPNFAEAHNNLGLAYTELNEEEKATEAFTRAIELNPSLPAAYNNLGYILFKQGNYDQAIEMYNEALGRSANNSSAYTNLGNAYYKLDKKDEAYQAWTKALEIDPGNEKAKKNLQRIGKDTD